MKKSNEQKKLEKQAKKMYWFAEGIYEISSKQMYSILSDKLYRVESTIDSANRGYARVKKKCTNYLENKKGQTTEECLHLFDDLNNGKDCSWWKDYFQAARSDLLDFIDFIESANEHKKRLENKNEYIREIIKELEIIRDNEKNFKIKKEQLWITTNEITLSTAAGEYTQCFGEFEIEFCIEKRDNVPVRVSVYTEALDPNPARRYDDHVHPHISGTDPCLGEARPILDNAFMNGSILIAMDAMKKMLNTYNASSPYTTLEEWEVTSTCNDCRDTIQDEDEERYCEHCDETYCLDCWYICEHCSEGSCSDYTSSCGCCDNYVCEECQDYCEECSKRICRECAEICEGSGCDNRICRDCRTICNNCQITLCDRCIEEGLCGNCLEEKKKLDEEDSTHKCENCSLEVDEDDLKDIYCSMCNQLMGTGCEECSDDNLICHKCFEGEK